MKVVYFPSMWHIFQISLGRQENSLLNAASFSENNEYFSRAG